MPHAPAADAALTPLEFINALARGMGQVMLQDNRWAGLLFLAGVGASSPTLGAALLLGTLVGTATALALGVDRAPLRCGLFGFNGGLTALALLVFLSPNAMTWLLVALAAAASTVLMAALQRLFQPWNLAALTAPFVLAAWCGFLASARLGRLEPTQLLPTASLPDAASVDGIVGPATVLEGLFNGVAQIFFQQGPVAGLLLCAGLALSSPRALAAALAGSLIGLATAWLAGAAEPAIRAGLYGFNPALTAIALWTVFLRLDARSALYGALACTASAIAFAAMSAGLAPFGLPALTFPFVAVTWVFLLAAPRFGALRLRTEA